MDELTDRRDLLSRIFISPDERRLRVVWRLLAQGGIMLAIALIVSFPLTIIVIVVTMIAPDLVAAEGTPQLLLLALSSVVALPAATLSVLIARRALDRRSISSLGLEWGPFTIRDLTVGFLIPLLLFALTFLLQWGLGWLKIEGWGWADSGLALNMLGVLLGLIGFIAVGFYEELLFRGYYLQNLRDGTGLVLALLLTSLLFAVAHLGNFSASIASTIGIFSAGYFLAYGWVRTRALWLPIGVHIGWNFFQGPVFGFAVSGNSTPSIVVQTSQGPELFTGGGFGPEAGLLVLPMMVLGSVLIWLYSRGRDSITDHASAS